jgi:adenylate kinase family enzyme
MRRVLVIGCGGAGKSTLARELAVRTGLPLVHLDRLYWKPGWTQTPAEEWQAVVRDVVAGERWVLDGNYGSTLELRLAAADTAIYVDMSRRTCLRRAVWRWLRWRGRATRSDLPDGCPESLDLEFLRWIWSYPTRHRPRTLERLTEFERRGGRVVVLRNSAEARAFLDSAGSAAAAEPAVVSIAAE